MLPTPAPLPPRDPRFAPQPTALCMLATRWMEDVPAGGLIVQEKIDGVRAIWLNGRLVSREATPIGGTEHIAAELRQLEQWFGQPMLFDGEFQVDGTLTATMRHLHRRGAYGDAGRLFLFDAVPMGDWRTNDAQEALTERLGALEAAVAASPLSAVSLLPHARHGSVGAVSAAAGQVWARGGEGLVVKVPTSRYHRGRSREWMKVKRLT